MAQVRFGTKYFKGILDFQSHNLIAKTPPEYFFHLCIIMILVMWKTLKIPGFGPFFTIYQNCELAPARASARIILILGVRSHNLIK